MNTPAPEPQQTPPRPRPGVMIPTYRRPDLARACVLQWLVQTLPPAIICVHQNGSGESYEWCIEDLKALGHIEWIHTPAKLLQQQWYGVPLRRLLELGCSHFFWADHDDAYLRDHAERCVAELDGADFTVASHCSVLYLRHDDYRFEPDVHFTAHSTGGASSSMAFTRAFAERLAADLERDTVTQYADNVLALATLPHFERVVSARRTTVYVSHKGSLTSAAWLDGAFAEGAIQGPEARDAAGDGAQTAAAVSARVSAAQAGMGLVLYGTRAGGYVDVTDKVIALCEQEGGADGGWPLPEGDMLRSRKLGDPAPNRVKHIVVCGLPDAQGRLVDLVLRDTDPCTFRNARGVLSAECPPAG